MNPTRSLPLPLLAALAALAAAPLALGCAPPVAHDGRRLEHAATPVRNSPPKPPPVVEEARESPPPSGPARLYRLPAVTWAELPGGVRLGTAVSRALPIVEIRVVIPGGASADGERPGRAALTGELLKDGGAGALPGRELLGRVEALGATLSVDTTRDATILRLGVTREHLADALALLGSVVQRPRLDGGELTRIKKRQIERAHDSARTDGQWGAQMTLYRDLYALPAERHPYASFAATPAELSRVTAADCRAFHERHFVPKNTLVIVAGDTTPEAARAAAEKAFLDRRAAEPPAISFTDPLPPESRKITLIDRPGSAQSDLFVGVLGPARADRDWPAFAIAGQVLGGGPAARLFTDVREQKGLAYTTFSRVVEVARGPAPLIAYAGTRTEKTGLALAALLEHAARLASTAPEPEEVEVATRYLADTFAIRMETVGAVAERIAQLRLLDLPDDHDSGLRKELRDMTPALAGKVAGEYVRPDHVIVAVAGDAAVINPMLSRFGEVKVVDPTRELERVRTLPANPGAPLEAPASALPSRPPAAPR